MYSLLRKEISVFFNGATGYLVVVVFLIINSLFIWIFDGEYNILDGGYSSLDSLFILAPWIFLFLVPAVTMRLFAEEKRTGTIELLFTRPLTDLQIILAKYLSGLVLVLMSLLPTLIYFATIYLLGNPVGNIDTGGTWGSYIGLFFLAAIYVSVGVFTSAITTNQIIAFITGMLVCFILYTGFDSLSGVSALQSIDGIIVNLGINEHYKSMSRGVIDSRDVLYFIGVIAFFILLTRTVLQSRKW